MKSNQISLFDLLTENEQAEQTPRRKTEIPYCDEHTDAYRIPEQIWETRCRYCIHKRGEKNIPIPKKDVHRPYLESVIPCRIMAIAHPGAKMPGECFSFSPRNVYGICETCKHNNIFHDGYCMKEKHGEERRVFYGQTYNNGKPDYWGRHRLSVCDDYEPESADLVRTDGKGATA